MKCIPQPNFQKTFPVVYLLGIEVGTFRKGFNALWVQALKKEEASRGVVVHIFTSEAEASRSLVYRVNSRTVRATQRDPCLKKKKKSLYPRMSIGFSRELGLRDFITPIRFSPYVLLLKNKQTKDSICQNWWSKPIVPAIRKWREEIKPRLQSKFLPCLYEKSSRL